MQEYYVKFVKNFIYGGEISRMLWKMHSKARFNNMILTFFAP